MMKIAPEALSGSPAGIDPTARLGVAMIGLGGYGVQVVERLNNRFDGRPEDIGLHPLWIDSVRDDGYSSPSGPFALSFVDAETRFLPSTSNYDDVLREMASGRSPSWAPPISLAEARALLDMELPPMIGFGGQPVPSFISATLTWPSWEQTTDTSLRAASTADPSAEPLTVVVTSLYGGTGIGHLPVLLQRLRDKGRKNIAVFVALPSHADELLKPQFVPDAHARGIAVLRGILKPRWFQHLFLIGSGNSALRRDPRGAAVEVAASTIAAWLENPPAFRSEQATWLGTDFQGAAISERLSGLGAAELVFPIRTLARQQACEHAALAWRLVTEIDSSEAQRATNDGIEFAWSDSLTRELREALNTSRGESFVARFGEEVVNGQVRTMLRWFETALPETEPIDLRNVASGLEGQPAKVADLELIRLASSHVRAETRYIETALRKARSRHIAQFTASVRSRLLDEFGGANGANLGERPWVLRRCIEWAGATARVFDDTAERIRADRTAAHEELQPLDNARAAVEMAAAELPHEVRIRDGLFTRVSPEASHYVDSVQLQFDVTVLDTLLILTADHLQALAAVCRDQVQHLQSLCTELDQHRQACQALAGQFDAHLRHLYSQPTLHVVPSTPEGRDALKSELAASAAGDVTPVLAVALLSRIRLELELRHDGPPQPLLIWPAVDGFTAAAQQRRTITSRVTGALSSEGTTSVIAAAYLPKLAYSLLQPQYSACTIADALAVDYARGWAAGRGGVADEPMVHQFIADNVVSPLLRSAASTVDVMRQADQREPVTRQVIHLDQRSPRGLVCVSPGTAELMGTVLGDVLSHANLTVVPGAPGRAVLTTVVNRISWHRVSELHGRVLDDYHRSSHPVHLDRAARRAHAIEQKARDSGHLGARMLDPQTILLLDDPDALRGFLGLVATGRMPIEEGDLLAPGTDTFRINIAPPGKHLTPEWRPLGLSIDPLAALLEVFQAADSSRLRKAITATWAHEQTKLLADCGGDYERARDLVRLAMKDLHLPATPDKQNLASDIELLALTDTL